MDTDSLKPDQGGNCRFKMRLEPWGGNCLFKKSLEWGGNCLFKKILEWGGNCLFKKSIDWSGNCLFMKICLELSGCVVYLPISSRRGHLGSPGGSWEAQSRSYLLLSSLEIKCTRIDIQEMEATVYVQYTTRIHVFLKTCSNNCSAHG